MELHGAAATIVMDVVPCRFHVIGITGKIDCMLLFAGCYYAYIGDFIAQILNRADFIGGKASVLAIGSRTLKVVANDSPVGGERRVHALFARVEEQAGHGYIIGGNADVGDANAVGDAGTAQSYGSSRISHKCNGIARCATAFELECGVEIIHRVSYNSVFDVAGIASFHRDLALRNGGKRSGKTPAVAITAFGRDKKQIAGPDGKRNSIRGVSVYSYYKIAGSSGAARAQLHNNLLVPEVRTPPSAVRTCGPDNAQTVLTVPGDRGAALACAKEVSVKGDVSACESACAFAA